MTIYILFAICIFCSLMNLVATVLLSNSVFRLFGPNKASKNKIDQNQESGLVDPAPTPTYDVRFRPQKT